MLGAVLSASLLTACDTQCVGPSCETEPEANSETGDDDDSSDSSIGSWQTDEWEDEPSPQRSCSVQRRHLPPEGAGTPSIAGEFSNWEALDMSGPLDDGSWSIDLGELAPGDYAYKYLYDGQWEGDPPLSANGKFVDGIENRALLVGDCSLPRLRLIEASADLTGELLVRVQFEKASDGAELDPLTLSAHFGSEAQSAKVSIEEDGVITLNQSGLPNGKQSLWLSVRDSQGRETEGGPLFVPLWVEEQGFDWTAGALYFPMTDRFRNGDYEDSGGVDPVDGLDHRANYQGGDYLGIIHALEEGYFESLGVRTLWLSPILDNPEGGWLGIDGQHYFAGYHGYWPSDTERLNPHFADSTATAEERLRELIDAAHERGIRVLLDLVLNHVHEDHPYFQTNPSWLPEGCVCGTDGCDWEERRLDCWFTDYLPDLNYRNHAIVQQVAQDALSLLETYDFDGFRLDAVKHMDSVIVRRLRKTLQDQSSRGAAPTLFIGETFTGGDGHSEIASYIDPWLLDGQFDFPLYWAIRNAFARDGSLIDLALAVDASTAAFSSALMSPFLGNHDVMRLATEAADNDQGPWGYSEDWMAEGGEVATQPLLSDRLAAAHAFVLSQPGMPLLYYGDEIGLAGSGDPDNRRLMNFEPHLSANQRGLLGRVQSLGQARAKSPALQRGERTELWIDSSLYVVAATAETGEVVITALHTGGEARTESIPFQELDLDGVQLTDLLDPTKTVTGTGGSLVLELPAWGYGWFSTTPPSTD